MLKWTAVIMAFVWATIAAFVLRSAYRDEALEKRYEACQTCLNKSPGLCGPLCGQYKRGQQ